MTEQVGLRAHGLAGVDAEQLVEGMSIQSLEGASQSYFDDMLQSEISVMTAAIPGDTTGGGIRLNSILKDGGNQMSGQIFIGGSDGSWQADNIETLHKFSIQECSAKFPVAADPDLKVIKSYDTVLTLQSGWVGHKCGH